MTTLEDQPTKVAPLRARRVLPFRSLGRVRRNPGRRSSVAGSSVLVAYVSEFTPTNGTGGLFEQVDRLSRSPHARRGIAKYYVDSGRPDGPPRLGDGFQKLIDHVRTRRTTVLVETVGRMGPDLATSMKGALALVAAGAEIFEVVGGRVLIGAELAAHIAERGK